VARVQTDRRQRISPDMSPSRQGPTRNCLRRQVTVNSAKIAAITPRADLLRERTQLLTSPLQPLNSPGARIMFSEARPTSFRSPHLNCSPFRTREAQKAHPRRKKCVTPHKNSPDAPPTKPNLLHRPRPAKKMRRTHATHLHPLPCDAAACLVRQQPSTNSRLI